jgi:hypothetical protein
VSARFKLVLLVMVFALCSLALKVHVFRISSPPAAIDQNGSDIATFLAREGYLVSREANSAPTWIGGTKALCTVRVADISPDGWFEAIVKEQTRGELLKFAFEGAFYENQPTIRTKLSKYKARFLTYFSIESAPVLVRAVSTSDKCSADVFSPDFALGLS